MSHWSPPEPTEDGAADGLAGFGYVDNGYGRVQHANGHARHGAGGKSDGRAAAAVAGRDGEEDMPAGDRQSVFEALRHYVQHRLMQAVERGQTHAGEPQRLRTQVRLLADGACRHHEASLSKADREFLVESIIDDVFGYGPLQPLMDDPDVSDVLVNGHANVQVERNGTLHAVDVKFASDRVLLEYIQRLVARVDRRVDESRPMVDAHLPDGSRLNAIIPPLSRRGPTLSIRRFRAEPIRLEGLHGLGTLTPQMAGFLARAVAGRANIVISGGTGSGKTTLLNALSRFIPRSERVISIEHTAELQIQHDDVISLEARPPNIEGKGQCTIRDLLKNTLRMRPDRIIVGECRGAEVFDVLQAMITGHDGSMTTIHAGDTTEALRRLELMMTLSGHETSPQAARSYIESAVHLFVHMQRLSSGERKITRISELVPGDGSCRLEHVYGYHARGARHGRAAGHFHATGYRPLLVERLQAQGVDCPAELFAAGPMSLDGSRTLRRSAPPAPDAVHDDDEVEDDDGRRPGADPLLRGDL